MTTLYKRDKKGNLLQWTIEYNDNSYWTTAGRTDGKLQKTAPTYVTQKNVGKANETSLNQQTLNEVESKIKYQLDHGYSKEIPGEEKPFAVSLSDKYPDRQAKGKLEFPYIVQPKYDGLRCYMCMENGKIVTNGGRVLGVTAKGATLKEARQKAYDATEWVSFDNKYMRHDIGKAIDEA